MQAPPFRLACSFQDHIITIFGSIIGSLQSLRMKKQFSSSIFPIICTLLLTTLTFSCEVFRKAPEKSTVSRGRGRPAPTRKPAAKAPARRPTPSKPTYAKPGALPASEIPQVVQIARTYTGTPYRSGGNDKSGIDCSGLICSVYSEIGVKVPRISWQQSEFGQEVSKLDEIKPGDWLFFVPEAGKEGYVSHAGIVTDVRGQQEIIFIHASTSRGVREDNLFSTYFKGRFVKAMRPF
jgi:probable lipoprotein NlpC